VEGGEKKETVRWQKDIKERKKGKFVIRRTSIAQGKWKGEIKSEVSQIGGTRVWHETNKKKRRKGGKNIHGGQKT